MPTNEDPKRSKPLSEAQKRSNSKHDKEHWEYLTVKAHVGAKERVKEAASKLGKTTNGFMREVLSEAVEKVIGKPLEPSPDDTAKAMYLRIVDDVISQYSRNSKKVSFLAAPDMIAPEMQRKIIEHITDVVEGNPSLYKHLSKALSDDLPPTKKGKEIRDAKDKTQIKVGKLIREIHEFLQFQ